MASTSPTSDGSWWERFWHEPVRAERLALVRILLGLALLSDQLIQYAPNLMEFYGATGVAPQGLHDAYQLRYWRWTVLFFNHDDPAVLYPAFWSWVAVTFLWTVGFCTRLMNVLVWFGALCWLNRNPNVLNAGDDTLQLGLFLLLLMPTGRALSVDAWLRRWRSGDRSPGFTPAWPVRVLQIELSLIYFSSGLVKLKGEGLGENGWPVGSWWDGTMMHYVLNFTDMTRWSYAQLPLPFWLTAAMTYTAVWWEALFALLVLCRYTRPFALWFGVLFHAGIFLTIEVGWFSLYMIPLYAAWIPDRFWERSAECGVQSAE
jgi:hypothetical protein